VKLDDKGDVTVIIGSQSSGQGHATAYAQLVAEQLGLAPERIHMIQGDTDKVATGGGTGGSSSIPCGGASLEGATKKLAEQIRKLAADALEASAGDLEIDAGTVRVAGTDRVVSFADLASRASADQLTAADVWTPEQPTYPNGTHIAEVEIDEATGRVEIVNYVVVDDFGMTINPLMLEGQIHGGAVQGIGQALMENTAYDPASGQLLSASLMDYALPRAADSPSFAFETSNVPCKTNPLGVKGAGEAGAIGSCPAVINAILDALWRTYRVREIDMPATPQKVWAAIERARLAQAS
jgi:carbon-monoxide dehydrogenase large subunit